jgi:hypothetical protein
LQNLQILAQAWNNAYSFSLAMKVTTMPSDTDRLLLINTLAPEPVNDVLVLNRISYTLLADKDWERVNVRDCPSDKIWVNCHFWDINSQNLVNL